MAMKEAGISNQMVGSKCEGLNASYLKMCVWFYVNHLSFSFTVCNKLSPKNYLVIHMAHQSNANPCTVTCSPLF